jgi:rare lipoprotein A
MQTKLRIVSQLFAASLLWASLTSAATLKAKPHAVAQISAPRPVGIASWYGKQHQGRKMANGKRFDRNKLTAASWYLPLGTVIRVMNLENGKSVVVTVTDRGPNHRLNRVLDLSEAAAEQLDYIDQGLTRVFFSSATRIETEDAQLSSALIEPSSGENLAMEETHEPAPSSR